MSNSFEDIDTNNCVLFWRSVLNQALIDAIRGKGLEQRAAVKWIFQERDHFNFVCDFAQVEADRIKRLAINKLATQDPNIIEKLLNENSETDSICKNVLTYKSVQKVKINSCISFLYGCAEIRAYVVDDALWFDLTLLNHLWKFIDSQDVRLCDLDTYIDPENLRKITKPRTAFLANLRGITQLAFSFENMDLHFFIHWLEKEQYKQAILKDLNYFYLKFKDTKVLAWIYQNELFLHMGDLSKIFFLRNPNYKKQVQQPGKYFYVYLNSIKRQLMVRADLLIEMIKEKNAKNKKHLDIKPELIQWIKGQQQLFEGEK